MVGGGLAYDVYVPADEVPEHVRTDHPGGTYYTVIVNDGREYYDYAHATMPLELSRMAQGWERYQAYLAHEKQARREMLTIARNVFPELARFGEYLPTLWTTGLMKVETSAERWVNCETCCECNA